MIETKKCSTCKKDKPLIFFDLRLGKPRARCRECRSVKEYQEKPKKIKPPKKKSIKGGKFNW